jgi:hypothetical protein
MNLRPGYRLTLAPNFHLDPDWGLRIEVGAGIESLDGAFFPRGPWRPPTAAELTLLTVGSPAAPGRLPMLGEEALTPELSPDTFALFRLPDHLREGWWELVDAAADAAGPIQGFEGFAGRVAEFLAFKGLPAPTAVHMEAVLTAAGERSIRRDPDTGKPAGLGPTVPPWSGLPPATAPRLHAVANLGDEASALVLLNLPLAALAELPLGETVGEVVAHFCRACPEYPPVRVRLGPGEGCQLPIGGAVVDGDPTRKTEPDVLLLISATGG